MDVLICCRCSSKVQGVEQLTKHYRKIHVINITENQASGFTCLNGVCNKKFLRFNSFIRHMKANHITPEVNENHNQEEDVQMEFQDNVFQEMCEQAENNFVDDHIDARENETIDIIASASKMMAKLQLNCTFTRANIDRVIDVCDTFYSDLMMFVEQAVTKFLRKIDVSLETVEVKELFHAFNVAKPFKDIRGVDKQIDNLKNNFKYIDPIEVPLGKRDEIRFDKKN